MARSDEKPSRLDWAMGWCSFIPMLGFVFFLVALILGAIKAKGGGWKVILLGFGGFFFNLAVSAVLIYSLFSNLDKLTGGETAQVRMAKTNLRETIESIEYYKLVHGRYPDKLMDMGDPKDLGSHERVEIIDNSAGLFPSKTGFRFFQYGLMDNGDHYYLYGVGPDGQVDTADDVYPDITAEEADHIGYRKKP